MKRAEIKRLERLGWSDKRILELLKQRGDVGKPSWADIARGRELARRFGW